MILRSNGVAFGQVSSLRVGRLGLDLAAVQSIWTSKQTSHVIVEGMGGSGIVRPSSLGEAPIRMDLVSLNV